MRLADIAAMQRIEDAQKVVLTKTAEKQLNDVPNADATAAAAAKLAEKTNSVFKTNTKTTNTKTTVVEANPVVKAVEDIFKRRAVLYLLVYTHKLFKIHTDSLKPSKQKEFFEEFIKKFYEEPILPKWNYVNLKETDKYDFTNFPDMIDELKTYFVDGDFCEGMENRASMQSLLGKSKNACERRRKGTIKNRERFGIIRYKNLLEDIEKEKNFDEQKKMFQAFCLTFMKQFDFYFNLKKLMEHAMHKNFNGNSILFEIKNNAYHFIKNNAYHFSNNYDKLEYEITSIHNILTVKDPTTSGVKVKSPDKDDENDDETWGVKPTPIEPAAKINDKKEEEKMTVTPKKEPVLQSFTPSNKQTNPSNQKKTLGEMLGDRGERLGHIDNTAVANKEAAGEYKENAKKLTQRLNEQKSFPFSSMFSLNLLKKRKGGTLNTRRHKQQHSRKMYRKRH